MNTILLQYIITMIVAYNNVSLCHQGVWMVESDAVAHLGITSAQMAIYKNYTCPTTLHMEHAGKVHAPKPYDSFPCVFISPEGMEARKFPVTLKAWAMMCDHFSKTCCDDNARNFHALFKRYTGVPATPDNITTAFDAGVLKRSEQLKSVAPKRRGRPPKQKTANANNNNNNNISTTTTTTTTTANKHHAVEQQQSNNYSDSVVDDIVPSAEQLTERLIKRLSQLQPEDIECDKQLSKIGVLMKAAEMNNINFTGFRNHKSTKKRTVKMSFSVCQCGRIKVCEARKTQNRYCRKCSFRLSKDKEREQQRNDRFEMRTDPKSKVGLTRLQPNELKVRGQRAKQNRDNVARKYDRLLKKLTKCEMQLESMSEELRKAAKDSLEYAKNNPMKLGNEVRDTLYKLIQEENASIDGSKPLTQDDVAPLIDMITEEIKNQCRVFNDQKNRCRYSSKLLGIAMGLYLRSGRTAYDQFQADSIKVYPSSHYLAKLKQSQQITDGCCITLYEDRAKMRGSIKEEIGQLVVDEMKMTKDLVINVKSNDIIGVTEDFISTKKIVKSWLDLNPDEIEDSNEPATHVNQWRYRSISGHTYNCEFWFNNGSTSFDLACQRIMDKLLRITADLMTKRHSLTISFEAQMHNFFKSTDYDDICTAHLPASLSESHPGCMLIGLMLSKLYKDWLTSALQSARQKRNPELFTRKQTSNLSEADQNNEVNSFVGWSIFSALKRYAEDSEEENESKRLLLSMIMLEEDADEEYMAKYYDTNIAMVNCGGLTLVSKYFFDWGKEAMKFVRHAFTHDIMTRNLRTCFRDGKRQVMENKLIYHKFVTLCQSRPMSFQRGAIDEVYGIVLQKMVHSRFAVVFRRWKEEHCQKHDVSLRSKLKASVDTNKSISKQQKRPALEDPDESNEIDMKKSKKS
ncbi:hypothetical protein ACHAWT_000225 [Skeletonema menzelii]